jgi:DNA damage-binding protein 1
MFRWLQGRILARSQVRDWFYRAGGPLHNSFLLDFIEDQASVEIQGIKNLWNIFLPSADSLYQSYLVQSYTWETRALTLGVAEEGQSEEVSEMAEIEIGGFDHASSTLFCGNLAGNLVVQVTPLGVRLINSVSRTLMLEMACCPDLTNNSDNKIFQATGNTLQVALALSNGEVILLELDQEQETLVIANRLSFEQDIACMCLKTDRVTADSDIFSFQRRTKTDLLVVGLWTDHSVRIHALPSLEEVCRVVLGGEETAQARHVVLAPLSLEGQCEAVESKEDDSSQHSSHLHLLVGLGDGTLVTYLLSFPLSGLPMISNKQEIRLGTHPVSLSCFTNKGTLCVFVGCDQPTVLFSRQTNDQLLYSPVNIGSEDITCVTPFFHPSFADCLALASDSTLILGNFDSLQRVHITSCPLGEAPRHITHHQTTSTLAGLLLFFHFLTLSVSLY